MQNCCQPPWSILEHSTTGKEDGTVLSCQEWNCYGIVQVWQNGSSLLPLIGAYEYWPNKNPEMLRQSAIIALICVKLISVFKAMLRSVTRRVHVFLSTNVEVRAHSLQLPSCHSNRLSALKRLRAGNLGMKRESKFDVSRLSVETGGMGDPAVFVHGFGSNKFTWRKVCRGLKDVFCFYAVDLPGSGASPAPRDFHYTLEHFADVLTDFIVVKDLKKLTLVGHSLGATIVLLAFLKNKDELAPRVPVAMSYRRNRLPGGVSALYEYSENASFRLARAQNSGFCESFFTPFFVVVAFISAGECQRSIDRNSRLDKHSTLCALLTTYQNHSSTYSGDLGA